MKFRCLPLVLSFLLPLVEGNAANVTWSTGGDAATGNWNNLSFNGQSYAGADTLIVDGIAKTITIGSGVTSPTNLNVTSANAVTLTGGSVGGVLNKSGAGALTLASANTYDIGAGRSAYFGKGSLQLVVVSEPRSALLGGLGLVALLRRRNR